MMHQTDSTLYPFSWLRELKVTCIDTLKLSCADGGRLPGAKRRLATEVFHRRCSAAPPLWRRLHLLALGRFSVHQLLAVEALYLPGSRCGSVCLQSLEQALLALRDTEVL